MTMKTIKNFKLLAVVAFVISSMQVAFVSCSDDPDAENYYTSTAEYAGDYILNREKFSSFSRVIERSNLMNLLRTYGTYTVFAPTNEAFDEYLASRGWTSVDEIPQVDCDTIALTHVISEAAYFTTDFSEGQYPQTNLLDQVLTISPDTVFGEDGKEVVDLELLINKTSRMIHYDDSVENGVVHTMNAVIGAKNSMLPDIIAEDPNISIFNEAFLTTELWKVTNLSGPYVDKTYSVGADSIDWTNKSLVTSTATEYDNVAYPKARYYKYTAFIETNDVYEKEFTNRGYDPSLSNLEKVKQLAKDIYDEMYPEDKDITDPTDRRNSLNRFISYHFLDRYGAYYSLTPVDGPSSLLSINWNRNKWDIADWYETMMPQSIMKLSFPNGSEQGLYVNRRGVQARADERGVKVRGSMITPPVKMEVDNVAVNGIYHYIDAIIHYGKETQKTVLDERLRIDASTLSPDFMNAGARGHRTRSSNGGGMYGVWDNNASIENKQTCLGFKAGFVKNFEYDNATHLHVRPRTLSFWSYQGDEVTVKGIFDFTVKLPPLPKGNYEIRLFTCVDFQSRGIVQAYFDGVPCGIPFDMRPGGGSAMIGWKSDASLGDDEAIDAEDKAFHNRGWMKGPDSYYNSSSEAGGTKAGSSFRDLANTIRKVIWTFYHDGKSDHYLRFQQKMDSENNEMNFDFIELCPSSVYDNEYYPEDKW